MTSDTLKELVATFGPVSGLGVWILWNLWKNKPQSDPARDVMNSLDDLAEDLREVKGDVKDVKASNQKMNLRLTRLETLQEVADRTHPPR
ncbi:hypothetical protein PE067_16295 [Paracoccus sp. DMF-8]|uniref:hypothetical protein n=1 Tax=Paracoccus sp. DMF-8 TaxID=3019445 RepID=UPI0023E37E69|nr:hypothetical protein [Paracoccus sp. DMF-8]MDF3607569.1 hypothetical protein [Paracoccus sp. DMF-8]